MNPDQSSSTQSQKKPKKAKPFLRPKNAPYILWGGLTIAFLMPWALTRSGWFGDFFHFESTGPVGDTIGGIAGPILNFVGLVLVYLSFKQQFRSNEQQKKALRREKRKFRRSQNFDRILKMIDQLRQFIESYDNVGPLLDGMMMAIGNQISLIQKALPAMNSDQEDFQTAKSYYIKYLTSDLNVSSGFRLWIYSMNLFDSILNKLNTSDLTEQDRSILKEQLLFMYEKDFEVLQKKIMGFRIAPFTQLNLDEFLDPKGVIKRIESLK